MIIDFEVSILSLTLKFVGAIYVLFGDKLRYRWKARKEIFSNGTKSVSRTPIGEVFGLCRVSVRTQSVGFDVNCS